MTPAITAKLASAAITAAGTPGRRRISRSGAAGAFGAIPAARSVAWSSRAIVRGSGRIVERDEQADQCHRRRDEPRDDERVELEVLPREKRTEDQRAERRTEQRPEEDVRDRTRLALGRVHVGRGGAREEHGAVHRADADEAEDHERRAVDEATEGGQRAADRADRRTRRRSRARGRGDP